jgi:hypothetical protein
VFVGADDEDWTMGAFDNFVCGAAEHEAAEDTGSAMFANDN